MAALLLWGAGIAYAADSTAGAAPAASAGTLSLLAPGKTLPSMVLLDRKGQPNDAGKPRGGPVAIYFWSVFCPNCKEAFPALIDFYRRWEGKGLTLWTVNVDGDRFSNAVNGYLDEAELPFPVLFDRLEGESLVAADPLGVSKTPTLYLADAQGRVLLRQAIQLDFGAMDEAVAASLSSSR